MDNLEGKKIEKENPFNVIKKERRWFGNKTILYEKGIITQGSFLENYDSLTKNNSTEVWLQVREIPLDYKARYRNKRGEIGSKENQSRRSKNGLTQFSEREGTNKGNYPRYCIRLFPGIKRRQESSRQITDSEVLGNEEKFLSASWWDKKKQSPQKEGLQ